MGTGTRDLGPTGWGTRSRMGETPRIWDPQGQGPVWALSIPRGPCAGGHVCPLPQQGLRPAIPREGTGMGGRCRVPLSPRTVPLAGDSTTAPEEPAPGVLRFRGQGVPLAGWGKLRQGLWGHLGPGTGNCRLGTGIGTGDKELVLGPRNCGFRGPGTGG